MSKHEETLFLYLQGAQQLFQQFGYKKTTMDDIAARCGVAKSTLYHYFSGKEDVFMQVVDKELNDLRQLVKVEVKKGKSGQEKVKFYFHRFHKEILNKRNLYRILFSEIKYGKFLYSQFIKLVENEKAYLSQLLSKAIKAKELVAFRGEVIEVALLAEVLLAAFYGILRFSIDKEDGYDMEKVENMLGQLIPQVFS